MTRSQLRLRYNVALAVALIVGFGLGYWLRQPGASVGAVHAAGRREYEADFPGCRERYEKIKRDFSWGPFVRTEYGEVLAQLEAAMHDDPGYLPYHSLQARVFEELAEQCAAGRVGAQDLRSVATAVGARTSAGPEEVTDRARALATQVWQEAGTHPLCGNVKRYGEQWRIIREQHLSALKQQRQFRVTTGPDGRVDLTLAFDRFGITRDHDRYVNNCTNTPQGFTFEEKHLPDLLPCPRHPEVAFEFPCQTYISAETGGTIRQDVDFFRTVMAVDGQKLDIEDAPLAAVHLLAFNVTPEGRVVSGVLQVEYAGGHEEALPMRVGPWRQSGGLLRDTAQRRALDAAYRDTELHQCNGQEVEMMSSPLYMYHVAVATDPSRPLDKLSFPRYDPSTVGLEEPGIADIRIVAITLQQAGS